MKRDLQALTRREFDVVVVGGGIYGAAIAREAALCGLATALIEKGDFCSATSANSLKIIHGGLRYLQQLDVERLRNSVIERRTLLRTAPHLVHPLPCVMPTEGHLMNGREVMFCGMLLNDMLSCDRNRLPDPEKHIPRGRIVSRDECCRLVPGLPPAGLTGGATWHDAYVYNSERLVTGMVRDAAQAGAVAANYVTLTGFHRQGRRVTAVRARDELRGDEFDIAARLVINAAGPWTNEVLSRLDHAGSQPVKGLAFGMNFVLRRRLLPHSAAGLRFRRATGGPGRLLFLMPWRGRTLAGTYYRAHEGPADELRITEQDIEIFLSDLAQAHPAAGITRADITGALAGLLPVRHYRAANEEPALANHFSIVDHSRHDGVEGLMTVVGVKYTTARDVARRAIRRALPALGRPLRATDSAWRALPGGDIADFRGYLAEAKAAAPGGMPADVVEHLVYNYGRETAAVLELGRSEPDGLAPLAPSTTVIGAEVVHAVRAEMAETLPDVVFRRTDLGSAGLPGADALEAAAGIMARERGWDPARRAAELAKVSASPFFGEPLQRLLR